MTPVICALAALPCLLAAATTDIAVRAVPNAICSALALDGVLAGCIERELSASILASLCVFIPAVVCWRHGFMGGGDVKLLGATSLLLPARSVPTLILAIAIAGGILGLSYWLMTHLLRRAPATSRARSKLKRVWRAEHHRIQRGFSIPYAVAIAAGTLFTLGFEATS